MTAIGIDFGTAGISAATWTAEGGFEILRNSDDTRRSPTYFHKNPDGDSFGTEAVQLSSVAAENTAFDVVTFMGVGLWEAQNICNINAYPFRFNRRGATAFIFNDGSTMTPEAITEAHLKNVSEQKEETYGVCVLTVPVEWPNKTRELFKKSAQYAGFSKVVLLDSHVAALLGAVVRRPSSVQLGPDLAVIDVGANSLTVTVWRTDQDGRSVPYRIASPGHAGNGIDLALMRYAREEWRKVYRVEWTSDGTATQCLRLACQEAKLTMAKNKPRTTIRLPNIGEQISLGDWTNVTINKKEFDGITEPLVTATVEALQDALNAAGLSSCNGVEVFLVGGTTLLPALIKAVQREGGKVHITQLPNETTTYGAAFFAYLLSKCEDLKQINLESHARTLAELGSENSGWANLTAEALTALVRQEQDVFMNRSRGGAHTGFSSRLDKMLTTESRTIYQEDWDEEYSDFDDVNGNDEEAHYRNNNVLMTETERVLASPVDDSEDDVSLCFRTTNSSNRSETNSMEMKKANEYYAISTAFKTNLIRGMESASIRRQSMKHSEAELVLEELIRTEEDYITDLKHVLDNYLLKIKSDPKAPATLHEKRNEIFGNIEILHAFHRDEFLPMLHNLSGRSFDLGKLFIEFKDRFNHYARYVHNQPKSTKLMAACGSEYFEKIQQSLGDSLDLSSFLLKPVQRLVKYKDFLERLLNCSTKNDMTNICDALDVVKFYLRHGDDLLAMDLLVNCVTFNVKQQGRLWRQADVQIRRPFLNRVRSRRVFLFDQLLLFSKKETDKNGNLRYLYKDSLKTNEFGMIEKLDGSATDFEVFVRRNKTTERYTLVASDESERIAWTKDIAEILWKQHQRSIDLRNSARYQ
ncbi:putative Pleckstrin-like proteiny domain-containing family G member 4B [Hypsibius exemplaris]|uniref:Pleckstrin-like proteiny domain-containing family G member 4B n=1 Tax=Hypsibius exemplaris TaxID=2072580 RepID=A0A1W0WZG3_HYPEX|nr:putative Pleckstrin-like proteiny domain-containing family G member 4B [Hypsibius exemplaris]